MPARHSSRIPKTLYEPASEVLFTHCSTATTSLSSTRVSPWSGWAVLEAGRHGSRAGTTLRYGTASFPSPTYSWALARRAHVSMLHCEIRNCISLAVLPHTEPGIRRGNEDSRGNENRKSRKKIFSVEKNQVYFFFLWKFRWRICECKLKVQNWYSSWILVCYISSNLPPECLKLHRLSIFSGRGGGGGGGGGRHGPYPPRNFLLFFH